MRATGYTTRCSTSAVTSLRFAQVWLPQWPQCYSSQGPRGSALPFPTPRVMIHQPLGGMQGQASDLEIAAREILKVKEELYTILSEHSGQPFETIQRDSDRDYWMTATEAQAYGMVDRVLTRTEK